jgi:tripartite-type tricarboxylate transporter receptor subunit TctC
VNHLVTELFMRGAGITLQHVPYKGMGDAVLGLLSGQVELLVAALPTGIPHVKSGKMTALAVSSANRAAAASQIPTAREQGIDFVTNNWVGFTLPKGSPPEAYTWMRKATLAALATPELRERIASMGAEMTILEGDPFDKMILDETARWGGVIQAAGIRAD